MVEIEEETSREMITLDVLTLILEFFMEILEFCLHVFTDEVKELDILKNLKVIIIVNKDFSLKMVSKEIPAFTVRLLNKIQRVQKGMWSLLVQLQLICNIQH